MRAVRLASGPKGYGIVDNDDRIVVKKLTYTQAMIIIRGGFPIEDEYAGNGTMSPGNDCGRRVPRMVHSHNEAQAPWDYMLGTNY